jgi:hypothetical protein
MIIYKEHVSEEKTRSEFGNYTEVVTEKERYMEAKMYISKGETVPELNDELLDYNHYKKEFPDLDDYTNVTHFLKTANQILQEEIERLNETGARRVGNHGGFIMCLHRTPIFEKLLPCIDHDLYFARLNLQVIKFSRGYALIMQVEPY